MHMKAGMFIQPPLHDRMFVRRVVVGNQAQRLARRRFAINLLEERQPFRMTVSLPTLGNDFTIEHVEWIFCFFWTGFADVWRGVVGVYTQRK